MKSIRRIATAVRIVVRDTKFTEQTIERTLTEILFDLELDYTPLTTLAKKALRNKNHKTKVGPLTLQVTNIRETSRQIEPRRVLRVAAE